MTFAWRAHLFSIRVKNPSRGLVFGIAIIGAGFILLGLLQGLFSVAAGLMGAGFLALWAHALFTSPVKRAAWVRITLVVAACVLAIGYSLWRGSVVPAVAAGAIITLAIRAYRRTRTPLDSDSVGFPAYLQALMYLAYAGLIFVWPRLATYLLVVIGAGTLIFIGATMLLSDPEPLAVRAEKIRDDARRRTRVRVSSARLTGRIAMAGLITAAIAASFFILGGETQRVPGGFYAAPSELPTQSGELISVEPFKREIPDGQQAWLILYSTQDSAGESTVGSAVVIAPTDPGRDPLPSVTIAPGTNGIIPECAPSLKNNVFATGHEQALVDHMIPAGWAGVIVDYAGLGTAGPHAYLDGETAAHNLLDARAAAAAIPELALADTTVIWGHSQGGGAALWAAVLSDQYGADLEVRGVAAAAPAADLPAIAEQADDDTAGKVIIAYLVESWVTAFDIDPVQYVRAGYQPVVDRISQRCFEGRDALANLADASQLSSPILKSGALESSFGQLLAHKVPPARSQMPVLIAQGEQDQLIRAEQQERFVRSQCDAGQEIEYRSYENLDHMPLVSPDSPYISEVVTWTQGVYVGEERAATCFD